MRWSKQLQQVLVQRELLEVTPTGFFGPLTEAALIEFQMQEGIISSKFESGAGRVGEKTQTRLNEILSQEKAERAAERTEVSQAKKTVARLAVLSSDNRRFQLAAQLASEDASIELLQTVLRDLGYFDHIPTGKMGPLTRASLKGFQVDFGVIPTAHSVGAGVFGPGTRAKLAEVVRG